MAGNPVPIGTYILFYINAPNPNGYLPCDGRAVSRSAYPTLFSMFNTNFGAGDGTTTFNLPDFNTSAVDTITYVKALDVSTGFVTDANTLGGQTPDFYTGKTMKNKLINGNFDVWQRGVTQSVDGYGSDDRWLNGSVGSTKVHSQQVFSLGQTSVPNNPTSFSRTVVTSVAGVGNYVMKQQSIEYVSTLTGKTATLSFWAKADSSKSIGIEFNQGFGTGGSPSASVTAIGATKINLTSAWAKYTVTVAIPSINGMTLGANSNDSLRVLFWFDAGSNLATRSSSIGQQSGTFDIAQVQLEESNVATAFEQRHIALETMLCKRYYELIPGTTCNNNAYWQAWYFTVDKRANPTLSISTGGFGGGTITPTPYIPSKGFRTSGAFTSMQDFVMSADAEL